MPSSGFSSSEMKGCWGPLADRSCLPWFCPLMPGCRQPSTGHTDSPAANIRGLRHTFKCKATLLGTEQDVGWAFISTIHKIVTHRARNDVKCHMFWVTVNHLIQHPTRALESRVEFLYTKGLENRNVSCDPFHAENFALKDEPRTPEHHGGQTGENPSYLTAFLDTYFHFHIMSDLCDRRKGGKRSWTDFPYYVYSGPSLVKILIPREESGPPMGSEPVSGGLYYSWMLVFIFFLTSGSQQAWS